jgi:two-component system, chemotaxis family, protein-glutamate methylesterase/glutaminase
MSRKPDVIVIGGSTGGLKAMRSLVAGLPSDFSAPIFVVLHSSPDSPGLLPEILSGVGPLPTQHAVDGDLIVPGRIYTAPPNRHLLLEADNTMRLTLGPKENRFRPAIDPLFRSAALAFGPRVVGILLSGGLDDGVAGLAAIKGAGGIAMVQDPQEAEVATLPRNALRQVTVDHVALTNDLAPLLLELTAGDKLNDQRSDRTDGMSNKELEIEVRQANESESWRADIMELGSPSMLTCPECHGTLMRMNDQRILRFRCHTGHAYTSQSLLAAIEERIEDALWTSVSAIEESAMLLGHMAEHVPRDAELMADTFRKAFHEALGRAKAVRAIISDGRNEVADSIEVKTE